ncbi:hypothetical protein TcCL_Unassigned07471, partial [Trypanosoma cruzi]
QRTVGFGHRPYVLLQLLKNHSHHRLHIREDTHKKFWFRHNFFESFHGHLLASTQHQRTRVIRHTAKFVNLHRRPISNKTNPHLSWELAEGIQRKFLQPFKLTLCVYTGVQDKYKDWWVTLYNAHVLYCIVPPCKLQW